MTIAVVLQQSDKRPEPVQDGYDRRRIVIVNALWLDRADLGPLLVAVGEQQDDHGRRPLLYLAGTKSTVHDSMRFTIAGEEPPHGFIGYPIGMRNIRVCLRASYGGDPLARAYYAAARVRATDDGFDDVVGLLLTDGGPERALAALGDPECSEESVAAFWRTNGRDIR